MTLKAPPLSERNLMDCEWDEDCRRQIMGYRKVMPGTWVGVCQKHYDDEDVEFHRYTLAEYAATLP